MEKYLTKTELELFNHTEKKREIKTQIVDLKWKLKILCKEYEKNTDTYFAKSLWITKQALFVRRLNLTRKIKRLNLNK